MDLPDNDVSSEDSESTGVHYHQNWNRNNFRGGPAFRWHLDVFVPQWLGAPERVVLNKVVIFALLSGQASYINWFLRAFHISIHSILYH